MSTIDQITALIGELSFSEKLTINEQLASAIRKEGKVKSKGDKEDKPKRKAALGTLAWTAYVKHIKTTQPDAFEGITKESEKLVIVKGIRADDPDGYKTFTDEWKASREASDAASVAESVAEESVAETASVAEAEAEEEPVPAPAPAPAPKKIVKAAAPAPKKEAPAAAPAPAPKAAEKAAKPVKKVKASE